MINGPQLIMQCQNGGANVGIGVQRGICNEIIKLSSNTTGHYYYIAKGRVRLTDRMNFRKSSKRGGGHFQSKNLYCKIWTFKQGFFSMKVIQKGLLGYVFTLLPC